jgi:hypothetical protein
MANKMPSQPPSVATLQEVIEVHLPYETIRLVEMYALLRKPVYRSKLESDVAEAVDDALLVAFCTHARNLLEFFFHDPDTNYYAAAMDYANPNYEKLDWKKIRMRRRCTNSCVPKSII